jgi:hypothetical protein
VKVDVRRSGFQVDGPPKATLTALGMILLSLLIGLFLLTTGSEALNSVGRYAMNIYRRLM